MIVRTETIKIISMSPIELIALSSVLDKTPDHEMDDVQLQVATDFKAAVQSDMMGK